jgi:hypothetical protein
MQEVDKKKLTQWIIQELNSINQSDPELLAEYVVTIVKQTKDLELLKSDCLEQLKPFLKNKLVQFVHLLFATLQGRISNIYFVKCRYIKTNTLLFCFLDGSYKSFDYKEEVLDEENVSNSLYF